MRTAASVLSSVLFAALLSATASGQPTNQFVATLSGANEVPPVPSAATGMGTFTVNPNMSVTYQVTTSGVVGTMAHLHTGAAGINGGIVVPLVGGPSVWAGTSAPISAATLTAMQTGGIYVNVHSAAFPAGEIRGQLMARQTFAGLPHTSIGKAKLDVTGGKLVVSNIGSSGQDGVEIALGATQYHTVTFETPGAAVLPNGAAMRISSRGMLNGAANQEILALRVEDVGAQFALSIDATHLQQATSITVEAKLGGMVVASATFPASIALPPIVTFPPEGCFVDPVWPMDPDIWTIVGLASSGQTTILGLPPVIADQIHLIIANGAVGLGPLSSTLMQADDISSFQLVKEQLGMFGLGHGALGGATMTGMNGQQLAIANIGSSGQDGVEIALGTASQANIELVPLSLSSVGAQLSLSATGTFAGMPNTDLGGASLTNVGGTVDVVADFSTLGASQVRVEVWKGPFFQGSAVVPGGVPGGTSVASLLSTGIVVTGCGKLPPDPPCIYIDFDDDILIDPIGAVAALSGNQLRVLANNANGQINSLSKYTLRGANLPGVTLTSECLTPVSNAYGNGCPTVAGMVPQLSMSHCAVAGEPVDLNISQALPNSLAILLIGLAPANIPVGGGCSLLLAPVVTQLALPLSPAGGIALSIPLPPTTAGITIYLQAFTTNPTPLGFAASNGFCLSIGP